MLTVKRRIFRLRVDREAAIDLAFAGARRDLREIEFGRIIMQGRLEFLEEKPVAKGCLRDRDISAQIRGGAETRTETNFVKGGHALQFLIEETESGPDHIDTLNFGSKRRRFVLGLRQRGRRAIRRPFLGQHFPFRRRSESRSLGKRGLFRGDGFRPVRAAKTALAICRRHSAPRQLPGLSTKFP